MFIFYRLLRPEFVSNRGRTVLRKVKLPLGYKFPTIKVSNPMIFAITHARSSTSAAAAADSSKKTNGSVSSNGRCESLCSSVHGDTTPPLRNTFLYRRFLLLGNGC